MRNRTVGRAAWATAAKKTYLNTGHYKYLALQRRVHTARLFKQCPQGFPEPTNPALNCSRLPVCLGATSNMSSALRVARYRTSFVPLRQIS